MTIERIAVLAIGICAVPILTAQAPSSLEAAKAIDQEILKLKELPDDARAIAIKDLALHIRQQPNAYAVTLAFNLAISAEEASGRDTLQVVTTTLADVLRKSPAKYTTDDAYLTLAELARYDHMQVLLDVPRYRAAMSKLEADDEYRRESDFTLTDVQQQKWNLKSLRGNVVLVNFWATWCPPCRTEIPDLNALYQRFRGQGFVILAISDEDASTVKTFLAQQKVAYPILLDSSPSVKELFRVRGIPKSFVYDREGRLVAVAIDRPTMQGFLEMLGRAGLR
jgi:peroxiredoxin